MPAFILTWDGSDSGYPPDAYAADIATTAAGSPAPAQWSFGNTRNGASAGDRVFLLRQGHDRGVVASGRLTDGEVVEGPHWDDPTKTAGYVRLVWDRVVPIEERLPIEELLAEVPGHHWNAIYSSGQRMAPDAAAALDSRWSSLTSSVASDDSWATPLGSTLSRRARSQRYGGALFGGIEPSATSSNVFLYSDPQAGMVYGYDYDGWSTDGSVFFYTGEGRIGCQRMREGNLSVLHHAQDGRALRLFVADGTGPGASEKIQRYIGEFRVDPDKPCLPAVAPDVNGDARAVFVFRLLPIGDVLRRAEDVSAAGDVLAAALEQWPRPTPSL